MTDITTIITELRELTETGDKYAEALLNALRRADDSAVTAQRVGDTVSQGWWNNRVAVIRRLAVEHLEWVDGGC